MYPFASRICTSVFDLVRSVSGGVRERVRSAECEVRSAECRVQSAECEMRSAEFGGWIRLFGTSILQSRANGAVGGAARFVRCASSIL